jgi:hydrogen cyanide synthase HcnC
MTNASHIVIAGGGVIGCAVAYYAARKRLRVTLVDSPRRGRATSASAGGTWPLGESLGLGCGVIFHKAQVRAGQSKGESAPPSLPRCFLDFSLQSNRMFPALAEELKAIGGIDIEFERTSLLFVTYDDGDVSFAHGLMQNAPVAAGSIEWMSSQTLYNAEPAITRDNLGALRFHGDDQVNPYKLADAYRAAARALGARILSHTAVTGVRVRHGRVVAVETEQGALPCDTLVNAAGSWAPEIGRMVGVEIPVHPVRGQIVCTNTLPPILNACLSTSDCYLAQKQHGEVIIGSTTENVGYDPGVTQQATAELCAGAVRAIPMLARATVKRVWSGFRPGSPDELPILGPDNAVAGYAHATGHFRTGIVTSPLTGLMLSQHLCGEPLAFPIEPFLAARFDGSGETKHARQLLHKAARSGVEVA